MTRRFHLALLPAALLLSGCDMVVMNASGDVARTQADLILWSTGLMLLIIVPVIVLTVLFAWRYRAGNEEAEYRPDWDHSTGLELVIWAAPLMIIIALGALTWVSTHLLDPYRPLARLAPGRPLPANDRPLEIGVVSLDWKWLFIYPEQGVATVNELVLPVDRQVRFRLTSSDVMNTFYVPAMAGMIYTMPGMETKLHAVLNRPGRYDGFSANYSGAGFSGMRFDTHAVDAAGFARWAAQAKRAPLPLSQANYLKLEKPSENVLPMRFGRVDPALFDRIVRMCVRPGTPCMGHSAAAHGSPRAPVNDRLPPPDKPEGALTRSPAETRPVKRQLTPTGPQGGKQDQRGADDRNTTVIHGLRLPPAAATAHRLG